MTAAVVIDVACTGCGMCIATCPEHALRRAPRHPSLEAAACTGCLACVEICPVDAIAPIA